MKHPCRINYCIARNIYKENLCLRHFKIFDYERQKKNEKYIAARYKSLLRCANDADRICEISFNDFKQLRNQLCNYCKGALSPMGYGLDRMDNTKDYTLNNVIPCCGDCNRIKNNILSYKQMMKISPFLKEFRCERDVTKSIRSTKENTMKEKKNVFITEDQRKELQFCMQRCWQTIGSEIIQMAAESGESSVPKDEVVDVVIDQMDTNGGMSKELSKLWNTIPFEQMQDIANDTFKFKRYGM